MTQSDAQSLCDELNHGTRSDPEVHWTPRERQPGHWVPIGVRFGLAGEIQASTADTPTSISQLLRSSPEIEQRFASGA